MPAIPAAKMQELLPASIGAFQRTATESMAMGPMGSTAEGTYTQGDKSFELRIVDMAGMGALAGLGAAIGVEQSREDADGYERTSSEPQSPTGSWWKPKATPPILPISRLQSDRSIPTT